MKLENGYLIDEHNNRAGIEYFGGEEEARTALESLINCKDCINCENLLRCSECLRCRDSSDLWWCSDCTRCSGLSRCSDSSGLSDSSDCSHCSDRSDLSKSIRNQENELLTNPPHIPNIHKKVFEAVSANPKALDMSDWHRCETTHCRAGWVVHLAGERGYALEKATSTPFAAMQIYKASGYLINPTRFYDSNEDAFEDMKRLAELKTDEESK